MLCFCHEQRGSFSSCYMDFSVMQFSPDTGAKEDTWIYNSEDWIKLDFCQVKASTIV